MLLDKDLAQKKGSIEINKQKPQLRYSQKELSHHATIAKTNMKKKDFLFFLGKGSANKRLS